MTEKITISVKSVERKKPLKTAVVKKEGFKIYCRGNVHANKWRDRERGFCVCNYTYGHVTAHSKISHLVKFSFFSVGVTTEFSLWSHLEVNILNEVFGVLFSFSLWWQHSHGRSSTLLTAEVLSRSVGSVHLLLSISSLQYKISAVMCETLKKCKLVPMEL